jgi:tetratricopeptide (TPR) repeat protein
LNPDMPASSDTTLPPRHKLHAARERLAAGNLADAERLCGEFLAEEHDNPEAIFLLAALVRQRGDNDRAKQLWQELLADTIPPWLFLPTLHNLLQTLVGAGATDEAQRLALRYRIPDWPAGRALDEHEREALLQLVDNLVALGRLDASLRLLESLVAARPGDARLLFVLGQVRMGSGKLAAAWEAFSAADAATQPATSFALLTSMMQCAMLRGDGDTAHTIRHRVAVASPAFAFPARPEHRATLLVLNNNPKLRRKIHAEAGLHFPGNFPSQLARVLRDEFRFAAVFAGDPAGRAARAQLPAPDVIINNYTNAETLVAEGDLATLAEFADSFGVPVVNHPDKVPFTAREKAVELLEDIPGLVIPGMHRIARNSRTPAEMADEVEALQPYPLLTRLLRTQQGVGMSRVGNRQELLAALAASTDEALFVSPFIDSRGPSGLYRKLRAAVVQGELFLTRVDHDHHWMVHGRKNAARAAFYLQNRHLLEAEDRICRDPAGELGEPVMRVLQAVAGRIPLDIFGIDFDVDRAGQVVFFEANATMNLLSTAFSREVDYPRHAEARMLAAIRSYLLELL